MELTLVREAPGTEHTCRGMFEAELKGMMRSVDSWEGEGKEGRKELIDGTGKGELDLDREEKGNSKVRERERPSAGLRLRAKASE